MEPIRLQISTYVHRIARIIHQPEKAIGKVNVGVEMNHQTTVSQVDEAPQSISSGRPDTVYIGRRDPLGAPHPVSPRGLPQRLGR
jgi:hypothetical protein